MSRSSGISISLKILQLISTVAALIFKKITDNKARMTFKLNQKTSNEWNLLQNVTWSIESNDYSIFTYAGYTFIVAVCLMERLINTKKLPSTTDTLFLRFGVIIFCLQGILVFYTVEYVPENIRLNALILGSLTFICAVLFFLEDCLTAKEYERDNKFIQTETIFFYLLVICYFGGRRTEIFKFIAKLSQINQYKIFKPQTNLVDTN